MTLAVSRLLLPGAGSHFYMKSPLGVTWERLATNVGALVDGKPSWGTPNLPAIIMQGRAGGEWMEEGEGREDEAGEEGLDRGGQR